MATLTLVRKREGPEVDPETRVLFVEAVVEGVTNTTRRRDS